MPRTPLSRGECLELLERERVARIAFADEAAAYLIPLGYVWLRSALYGVTEAGHKTALAARNSRVAFQVDTSATTGMWDWESVTGVGEFVLVTAADERQETLERLQPIIAQAPGWWRRDQAERIAAGDLLVWRLTPTRISGCRYGPSRETSR